MTKTEWKELYSEYRQAIHEFDDYMSSSNFPCGHDDMLYERHADNMQAWLQDKPELKKVLSIIDQTDILHWRQDDLSWYEPSTRSRYLKMRMTA